MAKRKPTQREFDWRTYSKPARILTTEQEAALTEGVLAPLLEWSSSRDGVRFEVRTRQAAIYHKGTLLLRVRGNQGPFVGEIDANVRLPRGDRTGSEQLEIWPLSSAGEVSAVLGELDALRVMNEATGGDLPERAGVQAFASANDGRAVDDPVYVVVDTEYQYGKRRFDFVAMRRAEGVGGLARFTTPRLVFGQFKTATRSLSGNPGLVAHAADFADFAQALGGFHLESARLELDELAKQKVRLGLLSAGIPFRRFTEDRPEYLVVLSGIDLASPDLDSPLAEMHDRLVARHHPPELLRLVGIESRGDQSARALTISEENVMDYRGFKRLRKQLRASGVES